MKKHLVRVVNANFFSRFIKTSIVVFLLTGATSAFAGGLPENPRSGEPNSAEVTYVTTTKNAMFFDVRVENAAGEKFLIVVKDENGTTLYRGAFADKDFRKRFIVPKTDASRLTFFVKSEAGSKSESFEINTNTRVVEETVVKKLL